MANKITWDQTATRRYETGVDHCVLYPMSAVDGSYPIGYAWNGITGITESPSGAEASPQYADNIKYLNLMALEEFGATIEAFTYPDEFAVCDGSAEVLDGLFLGQQARTPFGLCYRTVLGNDVQGDALGYKLHLIYGCTAAPSERAYATINDSPEAIAFSWEITTISTPVTGHRAVSSITIDSTKVNALKLAALEVILYGVAATTDPVAPAVEGRLPLPAEIITLLTP